MPQVLKEEIRSRILDAAREVFAARGFPGATMAMIAERAGLGTASLYRYYPGKDELFGAIVTPALAARFESLLETRVRALSRRMFGEANDDAGDGGEEMLRFWVEHRLAVVILLDRAEGSPYARSGERFVELLVASTLAEIRAAHPGVCVSAPARFVLVRIFENTRRMLASILEAHEDPCALREAIEAFWSYQIPGLRGFAAWIASAKSAT